MPRLRVVNLQVLAALDADHHRRDLLRRRGRAPRDHARGRRALLALVIAPIATELPEKFNSIIWVRQGKDTLAMGNITGAMVFQSTIPTVVALVFASSTWVVTEDTWVAFASAGIAFLSSAVIFIPMARTGVLRGRSLLVGGVFYLLYLGLVRVRDHRLAVFGDRPTNPTLIYSRRPRAGARAC